MCNNKCLFQIEDLDDQRTIIYVQKHAELYKELVK